MNSDAEVLLSKLEYNEVGQLKTKQVGGGLQSTSYAYNERGWMTGSSSAKFAMQLGYNSGTKPQWNGNIATQTWGTSPPLA
jgi:hypothetical protein